MLRIIHSRDRFFARYNNILVHKQREDGTEYIHSQLKTPYDTSALKFIHHIVDVALYDNCDVTYTLTHITDVE